MALEALEGIDHIGGYAVVVMDDLRGKYPERFTETGAMDHTWFELTIRPHHYIYIRKDKNSIAFTLQKGPIKEVGVNGCQVDTLLYAARDIIAGFNSKYPCRENSLAITKIEEAIHWLKARTAEREMRGVEGTSQR